MPDMYSNGEYDLAGFAVGAVERNELLPRVNDIKQGDVIIALPSSGVHSNGFSLVRKVLKLANKKYSDVAPFSESNRTIGAYSLHLFYTLYFVLMTNEANSFISVITGDELLEPTKIYVKGVISALRTNLIKAFAHITGGGLTENIPRILPENVGVVLDATKWKVQPIFGWLAAVGKKKKRKLYHTYIS